jgi:acyl carrier protein
MSEVAVKVKTIIAERLARPETAITNEASFANDLGADSLDTVELIMDFENAFDIKIAEEDAQQITTVGEAIEHIEKALAEK